jgi:hypothetical protein
VHVLHQRRHAGPEHQHERRHALHHQLLTHLVKQFFAESLHLL